MSRVAYRLPFALCLALLFMAQARLNAATAPSTEAFLATLSDKPPCEASSSGNAPVDLPSLTPAPMPRVLYPDCGVRCSEYQCSGGTTRNPAPTRWTGRGAVSPRTKSARTSRCIRLAGVRPGELSPLWGRREADGPGCPSASKLSRSGAKPSGVRIPRSARWRVPSAVFKPVARRQLRLRGRVRFPCASAIR